MTDFANVFYASLHCTYTLVNSYDCLYQNKIKRTYMYLDIHVMYVPVRVLSFNV